MCHSWQRITGFESSLQQFLYKGGSPGLVVMGDNSCSSGRGFESRRHILDILYCLFEKTKINEKEAEVGPFFINN